MKTAKFWHGITGDKVECDLCPHHCKLMDGKTGLCKVRTCRGGKLYADGYGLISSAGIDPIEKKPLYHFAPGEKIFSFGGWGCNLGCEFCQNWNISQSVEITLGETHPTQVVARALEAGSVGIAYTYNEPLIGIEFVEDCARLARDKNLANVLVTNGYVEHEPARDILPMIDALNIDIKSMDDAFYRRWCKSQLAPVLAFAKQAFDSGCHVEITNLIIPTLNDDGIVVERLAEWISKNMGRLVPLHLSAYRPQYKMCLNATPLESLERAYDICRKHLDYVYLGNVWSEIGQDTVCPLCGAVLISRQGYSVNITGADKGYCNNCRRKVDIIFR